MSREEAPHAYIERSAADLIALCQKVTLGREQRVALAKETFINKHVRPSGFKTTRWLGFLREVPAVTEEMAKKWWTDGCPWDSEWAYTPEQKAKGDGEYWYAEVDRLYAAIRNRPTDKVSVSSGLLAFLRNRGGDHDDDHRT